MRLVLDAGMALIERRDAFLALVRRDVRERYLAAGMGMVWMLLEPASFVLLLWIIFSNFRTTPESEAPFILYLTTGYAIWLFAAGALTQTTNVIRQYSFLVTKISFPVSLLPLVKITSTLIVHWVFLCIVIMLLIVFGFAPKLGWIQVLYIQASAAYLLLGISLCTSALNVFLRDVQELVTILVRFGFWLTPVFWSIELLPERLAFWLSFNPFYYLVEGYRQILLYDANVWDLNGSWWFWGFSTLILAIGASLFRRLRPYFAEVL